MSPISGKLESGNFVRWFRDFSPYVDAFRGRTFVIAFGGELLAEQQFAGLVHDIALLSRLGVQLVLVHGSRPQIEACLQERGLELNYVNGLRVTDAQALSCVKQAAGCVRLDIEALLSMGLANTPMAGATIRVVSGNFVTANPLGVRNGVDYHHTGEVRRIASEQLDRLLREGNIVLLSPIGYSPTGELFNLSAEEVATATAVALKADKLIYLLDASGLCDAEGALLRQLTLHEAEAHLNSGQRLPEQLGKALSSAINASRGGVRRTHLIDRHMDGSLLLELFTRDGIGTLISIDRFEGLRQATIDDVGGILELIAPLEEEGILVRRSRERLEMEIDHFSVLDRDGLILACVALYPYPDEGYGELACLAVHRDYVGGGRGEQLLDYVEHSARRLGLDKLFVLTTRTAHWFRRHGFEEAPIASLPMAKQALYNYQRRSKVFVKRIG